MDKVIKKMILLASLSDNDNFSKEFSNEFLTKPHLYNELTKYLNYSIIINERVIINDLELDEISLVFRYTNNFRFFRLFFTYRNKNGRYYSPFLDIYPYDNLTKFVMRQQNLFNASFKNTLNYSIFNTDDISDILKRLYKTSPNVKIKSMLSSDEYIRIKDYWKSEKHA